MAVKVLNTESESLAISLRVAAVIVSEVRDPGSVLDDMTALVRYAKRAAVIEYKRKNGIITSDEGA